MILCGATETTQATHTEDKKRQSSVIASVLKLWLCNTMWQYRIVYGLRWRRPNYGVISQHWLQPTCFRASHMGAWRHNPDVDVSLWSHSQNDIPSTTGHIDCLCIGLQVNLPDAQRHSYRQYYSASNGIGFLCMGKKRDVQQLGVFLFCSKY